MPTKDQKADMTRVQKLEDEKANPERIFEIHNAQGIWSCFC